MPYKSVNSEYFTRSKSEESLDDFFNRVAQETGHFRVSARKEWTPDQFPLLQGQAVYFMKYQEKVEFFHVRGFDNLLGYSDEFMNLEFLLSLVHPKHKKIYESLVKAAICFGLDNELLIKDDINLTYSFLCRHSDGTYVPLIRSSSIYESDSRYKMISSYTVFYNAQNLIENNKIQWRVDGAPELKDLLDKHLKREYKKILTPKEVEILQFIRKGFISKEIASMLCISKNTVDTHRRNMLHKTNSDNAQELINFALENEII